MFKRAIFVKIVCVHCNVINFTFPTVPYTINAIVLNFLMTKFSAGNLIHFNLF